MNKLFAFILSLTLIVSAVSCKHDTDLMTPEESGGSRVDPPTTPQPEGVITPVGTPEGEAITALIGPAGGTLESKDRRVRVVIPAGALASSQSISVQPITNNCPSGAGQAFRLTPHGITFAKPASITFQYDESDVLGSAPEALRIAFQTDKGSWKSPARRSLDTTARTLSVETTHFSDWTFFKNIELDPGLGVVNPGGSINLKVRQHIADPGALMEDLFVPLASVISEKYIKQWTVSGPGALAHNQSTATYYAPEHIPAKNPVAITVSLNQSITIDGQVFKNIRLVSNIMVAPEGISVQIDGAEWKTYTGGINVRAQSTILLGRNGSELCELAFPGTKTGLFRWTMGADVVFNLNMGTIIYQHIYEKNKKPVLSDGNLRVIDISEEWVWGTFTVLPAGWIMPKATREPTGTANINGIFRLRRVP
ncbi:hypothetical protein [Larkinella rosea]|uniref:ZU5 domain-containing protein n=1 Tax=Larkinella rosea TaxID=2025312 RepID=A0A3P1BPD6_9BACT|nr:hypothetical protein [Larkinella rosea]RRB02364.1 hypothetical protein EHT25_18000 [Larkinella rosea]